MNRQLTGRIAKYLASPDASAGKDAETVVEHLKASFSRDYARVKAVRAALVHSTHSSIMYITGFTTYIDPPRLS